MALRSVQWICLVGMCCTGCAGPDPRFAVALTSFTPGTNGGFGADRLPEVVLGRPHGGGTTAPDTDDVLSLGRAGVIVLEMGQEIVDGDGTDFRVFENAFYAGGVPTSPFAEPGRVAVSEDGVTFTEFPCDPSIAPTYAGCAGVHPVIATPGNGIDPRSDAAGGDAFDLATIGVARARYVRITDSGVGPMGFDGTDGFDLDAVAIVHGE